MIRSRLLNYAFLGTRHRAFDPLHELVRRVYLGPFINVFSRIMAVGTGVPGLRIEARNSAVTGDGFNVFSSDLDCVALIPPGSESDPRLARLLGFYKKSRAVLPFLGELELYTPSEWQTKHELSARGSRLFEIIIEIRRVVWQEDELAKARTPYHRRKALLAIQKRLDKIEPSGGLRAGASRNLIQLGPTVEAELAKLAIGKGPLPSDAVPDFYRFSNYLGTFVGTRSRGNPREVILGPPALGHFLAVLPDGSNIAPEFNFLAEFRKKLVSREIWRSVATHELLLVRSIVRQGRGDSTTTQWLRQLESELRTE